MNWKNRKEIAQAKPCPSGSGTTTGYVVEARFNYHSPRMIGGEVFDNRWREVSWQESSAGGIPRPAFKEHGLTMARLLTHGEAEALRWLFICAADSGNIAGSICLETRLVECRCEYSFKATQVAYVDAMDARGDQPKEDTDASQHS